MLEHLGLAMALRTYPLWFFFSLCGWRNASFPILVFAVHVTRVFHTDCNFWGGLESGPGAKSFTIPPAFFRLNTIGAIYIVYVCFLHDLQPKRDVANAVPGWQWYWRCGRCFDWWCPYVCHMLEYLFVLMFPSCLGQLVWPCNSCHMFPKCFFHFVTL